MLRRLHSVQPDSFEFTPANLEWARAQMTKYPEGRQQSAIIPVLWRAQEQEGWLSRPAIEYCAELLGMPYIRALEVATFYFMFQLQPVGTIANIQVCGTTSCMICGAEALIEVCKRKIAPAPHTLSADGKFSWEEVECLGACSNAPMAQIGKDYYEDLTPEGLEALIDAFSGGDVPLPGPQNGRFSSEPKGGLTSLQEYQGKGRKYNASVSLAADLGETVKRIDGSEVPILTKWLRTTAQPGVRPEGLDAPREGAADDLKMIKGVGPKLEELLNSIGIWHFDQIAGWGAEELAWIDENLEGFKGRASRDEWVAQAGILAEKDGGVDEPST